MMSMVPANSGTAPKAPEEPTWSALSAVCGLHCRPNRNSLGGTLAKKRMVSNSTDRTMPMVVSTATQEQAISSPLTTRSTVLRARKSGLMRLLARR